LCGSAEPFLDVGFFNKKKPEPVGDLNNKCKRFIRKKGQQPAGSIVPCCFCVFSIELLYKTPYHSSLFDQMPVLTGGAIVGFSRLFQLGV